MDFQRSEENVGISCQEVWRDVSDYIDEDLDPLQQARLSQHFAECRHCAALLDGMRNVIALYRDERVLAPPDGFHERLDQKLGEETKSSRRSFLAWTLTAAAAIPLGLALSSARRFVFQQHDSPVPAEEPDTRTVTETVAISSDEDDKLYHVAGCSHLRGKPEFISLEKAVREGYSPCKYCIGKAKPKQKS